MIAFELLVVLICSRATSPLVETKRQKELSEDDYSPDYYYADDELPFFDEYQDIRNPQAKEAVVENREALIHENQYPYIVGITGNELNLHCLGFLVTVTDVLTTHSCILSAPGQVKLFRVIAKTPVVKWLPTSNGVWHVNSPRSCKLIERCVEDQCTKSPVHRDLALLTTEYFELWYGYMETLPHAFIANRLWYDQSFKGCFITGVVFSAPSFVLLKRVNFTINQVFAMSTFDFIMPMLVGKVAQDNLRSIIPGGALMCPHHERFVPVGIYAGHFLREPGTKFDLRSILTEDLKNKCKDPMKDIIKHLNQFWPNESSTKSAFGLVLVFQNVYEWIDGSTYELEEQSTSLVELSSGFRLMPGMLLVFPLLIKSMN